MKRIITVLAVAALMAAMAMSVAGPALASNPQAPNNPYAAETGDGGGGDNTTLTYKAPRAERDPVTGEKPPPPGSKDYNAKGGDTSGPLIIGFIPTEGTCRGPGC